MARFSPIDPVGAFQTGRMNALTLQRQQQQIQQAQEAEQRAQELQPLKLRQAEVQLGEAERQAGTAKTQDDMSLALNRTKVLNQTLRALKRLPPERHQQALQTLSPMLQSAGVDMNTFSPENLTPERIEQGIQATSQFLQDPSKLSASMQEFTQLTRAGGLTEEEEQQAARIELGLSPRAVGSAVQTITEKGTVGEVAATEAEITGAKEEIKLIKQKQLKPEIESAVTTAVAKAKAAADIAKESRSNAKTLDVYETGMTGLVTALGGTTTGPGVGLMPAITANAQIAEGAVSAMAPILKQLFRSSGEGVFTDKDQELLMKMVPTRSDLPAAIKSKLENIDSIVRAKLAVPGGKQGGVEMIDAQGNRAIVFPDGTFKEL